jgi:hypothetical protein
MAKATITITDEDGGVVHVSAEFEPEINADAGTPAQHATMDALRFMQANAQGLLEELFEELLDEIEESDDQAE